MTEAAGSMLPKKLVVITGLSGSGKSSVLHLLEDLGFFTVDNLPAGMLPQLMDMLSSHPQALENGVGAVIDVRGEGVSDTLPQVLPRLRIYMRTIWAFLRERKTIRSISPRNILRGICFTVSQRMTL